ncbi:MAG: hypothetical protein CMF96_03800 [Candidatus Marinimicrobia bacterium]|nr:hypothetical protein [Candidatus Neomarinimicrobiota bacterium]|tara:strand:+ start:193 stop:765 length:573 start_codon:yes stop_codon:yes gene_type:complete
MRKLIIILGLFFLGGCMYYSIRGSIPAHINSISVAPIVNETTEFGIGDRIMTELTDYLIKQNILEVLNENEAESRLTITIKSLDDKPLTYSLNNKTNTNYERVEEWQIQIHAEINWHDLTRDESLLKTNLSPWGAYGSGTDISTDKIDNDNDGKVDEDDDDEFGSPRESAIRIAIDKLSEQLVNQITSTW